MFVNNQMHLHLGLLFKSMQKTNQSVIFFSLNKIGFSVEV